jgi:HAD superfamily hydrolase (TIGR01549 family)
LPKQFFLKYFSEERSDEALSLLIQMNHDEVTDIETYDGIPELLKDLAEQADISIWTGRDLNTAKLLLEYHDLEKFIDRCVSRDCVPRTKPHPDGLEKILLEAKHDGDEVVMVGDHEYDILGARSAGVKAISVDWHGGDPYGLAGKSDMHFTRVSDLAAWALAHY